MFGNGPFGAFPFGDAGLRGSIGAAAGTSTAVGLTMTAYDLMLQDEKSQLVYCAEVSVWALTD